jgi:type I restriction enzyme, S subunit
MSTSPSITGSVRQWRRYLPCRETGISWLGEVPSHWQVKRLKHICHMNPSKSEIKGFADDLPVSFLPMEKVSEYGGLDLEWSRPLGVVWQGFTYFRDSDVLVAKITPCFENGKGALARGLSNGIGFGTTELHVLRAKPIIDPQFLELVTRQYSFRRLGCMSMTGVAGQQRVSEAFISNFIAGIPPLDEQRRIVAFLDRETAKIDALIAKKDRLIELLQEKRTALISHAVTKGLDPSVPMKDSGVEWLGRIPAHWQTIQSRRVFQVRNQLAAESDEQLTASQKYGMLPQTEFMEREGRRVVATIKGTDSLRRVEPDDFVISLRSFQGGIEWCKIRGSVTFHYVVLKPVKAIHPAYFGQLFKSSVFIQALRATTDFIRDGQDLRFSHFVLVTLPLVPLEEQAAIATFLDRETTRIDALIAKVQQAIDKLREYRTALISAAVTGKIDVSSEAVAVASPTIAPEKPAAKPANVFFRRSVFAAEIIDRLCDEPTFGHVKFQKCLFVAQHHLRVGDFEESYKRMAAGPYDNRLVRSVDSQLERGHWFKAEKVGDRYSYRRLDKAGGHRQYFDRYFGEHAEPLGNLLDLFRPLDTDRAEIIATLYAVWNDFLLRGEPCDDDRIVAEVLTNWHDRKKRFEEDRWRRALGWMREKGLVPSGFGKPTVAGEGGS